MRLIVFLLLLSNNTFSQGTEAFKADYIIRAQAFVGGPSISKQIFNLSSSFQDKVTYESIPLVGFKVETYVYPWLSVGVEGTFKRSTISYEVSDSTLLQELDEKLGISVEDLVGVDPFGIYKLDLPRLRILAKANAHLIPNSEKSDLYLSLGLGLNKLTPRLTKNDQELDFSNAIPKLSLPVAFRLSIGYSYYFIPNVGIMGEIGIGGPLLSIGLTGRF